MESYQSSFFLDDPDIDQLAWLQDTSANLDSLLVKSNNGFPFVPPDALISFDINSNIPSPGSDESVDTQILALANTYPSSIIPPTSYEITTPPMKLNPQKSPTTEESPETSEDEDGNRNNKRKRREIKNKSETKRRNKFNEQLAALRSLLCGDLQEGKTTTSKITRDLLMSSAIQEITKLRQELQQVNQLMTKPTTETDTAFQRMGTGKFPKEKLAQQALEDPLNRSPYSHQDLERAFQVMYTRELDRFFSFSVGKRTEQMVIGTIRMLDDVTAQIQKPEYSLYVSVLEQLFYSSVKFIPKELKRCLEKNWASYQALKRADRESLILLAHGEIGIWILSDMSLYEYMIGNAMESERILSMARELCKKFSHRETSNLMLANLPFLWNFQRGRVPVHLAQKIMCALQHDSLFAPMATMALGQVLIANGQPEEGIKTMENGVCQLVVRWGDSADICMAPLLVEAYIQTRNVDKGIYTINYVLKKCTDLNIEGFMGKAELLRLKAKLLLMKRHPEFQPDLQVNHGQLVVVENVVNEILNYPVESPQEKFHNITSMHYNNETTRYRATISINFPSRSPAIQPNMESIPQIEVSASDEEVEILLRSALNLSHTRGMFTVEVRCAIDLARFFMLCGDRNQIMEARQILKDSLCLLKKADQMPEYQSAMYVLSQLEELG